MAATLSNHENGKAWRLAAAAAALCLLALLASWIDVPLSRLVRDAMETGRWPGDLTTIVRLSEAFAFGGTVAIIIIAAWTLDPRGWRVVPRLVVCAFGSGLAADLCKLVVARERPRAGNAASASDTFGAWLPVFNGAYFEQLGQQYSSGFQSFPSGHAATAVGLAIGMATLYPRGRWLFVALATLASMQRIQAGAHFLSDVLAGAALACLFGAALSLKSPVARWISSIESPQPPLRIAPPAISQDIAA